MRIKLYIKKIGEGLMYSGFLEAKTKRPRVHNFGSI